METYCSCCSVAKSCLILLSPWMAACQAPLSSTTSQSLLKFTSIELVILSNCLTLCHPLLLFPSIFPSIRVFFNESALHIGWPKYWLRLHQSFQWIVSVDFLYDWLVWSPCSPRDSQESSPAPQFEKHQFFFIETHSHSFFHVAHFRILQLIASKRLQFLQ